MLLFLNAKNTHVLYMFSSEKFKLMWHKIKNKTLVLHLSNIYKLTYLINFENALKK
jgi:hypothetical protein